MIKIGINFFSEESRSSQPLYKFKQNGFVFRMDAIESEVEKDNSGIYAEDVFNELSGILSL